jgi:hypothetical protein
MSPRNPASDDDIGDVLPLSEDEPPEPYGTGPLPVLPLEDEPSYLSATYLFPTERYRGEWRRHIVNLIKAQFFVAVYTGLLITLAVQRIKPEYTTRAVLLVTAGGVLFAAHRVGDWYFTRLVLTDKRLLFIRGVITRRVAMLPLLRVTDMSYLQSPLGRLLNFGTFRVESVGRGGPLRAIADLPNPNELYLRIVEEMYEPAAVEARLGASVADAVQEALQGPPMVNYDGRVGVELFNEDGRVRILGENKQFAFDPARPYRLVVVIAPHTDVWINASLVVTGGVTEPQVQFEVEVDSDRAALRRSPVTVTAWHDRSSRAEFSFGPYDEDLGESAWLWVRVSQRRRTLQSIELNAELHGRERA